MLKKLTGNYVGFEVITAVAFETSVFHDITPCSPLKFSSRRFGGTCNLHLQDERISQLLYAGFLAYSSTMKMEATCSSETSFDSYGLHGVISWKIKVKLYPCNRPWRPIGL
jgi:hypothetical protein